MKNINSQRELFEGKKVYDYAVHRKMPKIKLTNKRRRRTAYKGIVNSEIKNTNGTQKDI